MKKLALILIILTTLIGCSREPAVDTSKTGGKPTVKGGKPVPEFELARLNGGSFKSEDLRGKVTVMDFWATWCAPCISEIPKYNELKAKYAGKDVDIVGVTVESGSAEEIRPKVDEFQMKYNVVLGDDKVVEGFGGIIGYPTTFLISKDGTIYKKYIGSPPNKTEDLEKEIDALLATEASK